VSDDLAVLADNLPPLAGNKVADPGAWRNAIDLGDVRYDPGKVAAPDCKNEEANWSTYQFDI
jgi:hypothetical protein